MSLKTQKTDYEIAGGDHVFDAVQLEGQNALIQVNYADIVAGDVKLSLEQSYSPGAAFNEVTNSEVTVDPVQESHCWNLAGFVKGMYLRVVAKKGTAEAGVINSIVYLS